MILKYKRNNIYKKIVTKNKKWYTQNVNRRIVIPLYYSIYNKNKNV